MSNIPPVGPDGPSQNPTPAEGSQADSLAEQVAHVALSIIGSPTGPATPRQSSDEAANFATFLSIVREGTMGDIEHLIPKSKDLSGKILVKAAQNGRLDIIQALLAGANISDEDRGLAVRNAALGGRLDIIRALLANNAVILPEDRGAAVARAAENGHLQVIRELLPEGANIPEEFRGLSVIRAAENGHLEIVQALLANGTNISVRDRGMAVIVAAHNGRLDIIQALLAGANISDMLRGEAVQLAAENGHFEIVRALLNGSISDEHRGFAVVHATQARRLDIIRELLPEGATIPEEFRGISVIRAAENGHLEIVQALLQNRAIFEPDRGLAVQYAAQNGHFEIVLALLPDDATIPPEDRGVAVVRAIQARRTDIIRALLANNAVILPEDRGIAVIEATRRGYLQVVQELLQNGLISDEHRGWAVVHAAHTRRLDIIQALLVNGAISDEARGLAVRDAAAVVGHLYIIQALLQNGPISVVDRGKAVVYAAQFRHPEVVLALLQNGPISVVDRGGAVVYAAMGGHTQVIRELMRGPENSFIFVNHPQIDEAILRTVQSGNAEVLEALLTNIPSITSILQQSAITQARVYLNDSDRNRILDLLGMVNIDDLVQGAQEPDLAPDSLVVLDWKDVNDDPLRFLEAAVTCQFRHIAFGRRRVVVDLGGVSKQFLSTLTQALQDKKLLEIDDYTRLPRLSQGESLRPQQVDTLKYLGALISHLDRRNEGRSDKFMIGPIFHEEFFKYFRSDAPPFRTFFIDGNLKDSDVEAKYNESRIFEGDETYDLWKSSIQDAMSCIQEGFTHEFQLKIEANPNLGRELLGQKLTAQSILGSLKIQEGLNPNMVLWLQNWIRSTTDEKRQEFVFGITGNKFLSPMGILIKKGWREPANFEIHTCSNSLDLPDTTKSNGPFWTIEANFMVELNHLFKQKGYNIA